MYIALLELGAIVSTISISYFMYDFRRQTTEKRAETIVLSAEYIAQHPDLKAVFKQLGNNDGNTRIKKIIFTSAGDYLPDDKSAAYISQFDFPSMINSLDLPKNIEIVMPGEIKRRCDSGLSSTQRGLSYDLLDSDATYSKTGGTATGLPNCAVHTHKAVIALLEAHTPERFPRFSVGEKDRSLVLIPISHITSQFYGMLLRRAVGATLIYNPLAFDPSAIAKELIDDKITDTIATFGLCVAIANSPLKQGDLAGFKPTCGGEPTPKGPMMEVNERLQWAGAAPIVVGGGSTEFGSGIVSSFGIVGRSNETGIFFDGCETRIINPLTGNLVTKGERGILYARCPWQMRGYLDDPEATAEFFHYTDEEGKTYGTNGDIIRFAYNYKGEDAYFLEGRVNDFVMHDKKTKRFYPGISFSEGKVNPADFSSGYFLFDLRDRALNIPGVFEAETTLVPISDTESSGHLVMNLVVHTEFELVDVLKTLYASFAPDEVFKPEGVKFLHSFARSLSTDKRETASLRSIRDGYYSFSADGEIQQVSLPENGEPVRKTISNDAVQEVDAPNPKELVKNPPLAT